MNEYVHSSSLSKERDLCNVSRIRLLFQGAKFDLNLHFKPNYQGKINITLPGVFSPENFINFTLTYPSFTFHSHSLTHNLSCNISKHEIMKTKVENINGNYSQNIYSTPLPGPRPQCP